MTRRPIVIAHRGASGYLPEHTLAAKALAFGMGADYLEQDVVASRDGALLVFHDLILDDMTDVASRFPGRARDDGHFYCIDFTLAEIRELRLGERRRPGGQGLRFPGRFPAEAGHFTIPTLEEELRFIQGLIRSTGRVVGIYPEVKEPAWHRQHGVDLGAGLLDVLAGFGYVTPQDPVFVQCFDAAELRRLRVELGSRLRLVELIEGDRGVPAAAQLAEIARYANAIGPSLRLLAPELPGAGGLVAAAHGAGLAVHPYTLRREQLPPGCGDFDQALEMLYGRLGVDGLFTDFPDLAAAYVARHFPA